MAAKNNKIDRSQATDRSGDSAGPSGTPDSAAVDGVAGGAASQAASASPTDFYGKSFDALLETFASNAGEPESAPGSGISPQVIGWIRSPLRRLEDCPFSPEGAPEAVLEVLPQFAAGLSGLQPGQKLLVFSWLHLAERNVLLVEGHERKGPLRGVFITHSPLRPNPIGLHETTVINIENDSAGARVRVTALEALDGTPILDLKSGTKIMGTGYDKAAVSGAEIEAARKELIRACREAHAAGLLSGFNGNASLRLGPACLITRSGSLKADLRNEDFALLEIAGGELLDGTQPSSEAKVHLEIYRRQPEAGAVLHTHPPKLMALGVSLPGRPMEERLKMPVFEADLLRAQLASTPRFEPGGPETAEAAGALATAYKAVWLEGHGLCVWGADMRAALGLSEELEHLAGVRLAAMSAAGQV